MTSSEPGDRAFEETPAGAVQGGGEQDAAEGPEAGEFVIDHDADPPEEVQPTTS
jgi:hypothetical protein